jgi:predicted MFS family arabinose efflux permease
MTDRTLGNPVANATMNTLSKYKVEANSKLARIFLAFLTTAGIFYVNIMPVLINGLKVGLGFSNQQAGFISSANLYGAAAGALLAVFIVKKIPWRQWAYTLLALLVVIDVSCIYITSPETMIAIRALHGLVGGLLVGIGFAIISRTQEADRTFGYLLFIQWGLGGLGIMYLPSLMPVFGTSALFLSLVAFTLVTLIMMPFLPNYSIEDIKVDDADKKSASKGPLALTLIAIFLFQAANMGLFAYMIGLGTADGLAMDFMSNALGWASWIALIGAFLVMTVGTKYGRTLPLIIAILVTAICSWLLHFSESSQLYLITNIIIGITWAFVLPYLFGICSELDKTGQLAAAGGFASKMGLATGPMVGALMLGGDNYGSVIDIAAIGLIACAFFAFKPANMLDKKQS